MYVEDELKNFMIKVTSQVLEKVGLDRLCIDDLEYFDLAKRSEIKYLSSSLFYLMDSV